MRKTCASKHQQQEKEAHNVRTGYKIMDQVLHCCLGLHLISYSSHCFLDFYYEVSGYVVLITSFI